jgi:predicted transcriptional regulator
LSKEGQGWHESHNQSKPNQAEQSPYGGGNKSPERQPLPNVWDVLERKARRSDNCGRTTREEWEHEREEVDRLKKEIDEKGTDRDKHILALLYIRRPRLSLQSELEQIQEWRSLVEQLTDDELAECTRKQKEEIEAFRRRERHQLTFHPSAGDGELILAEHIAKKGKRG